MSSVVLTHVALFNCPSATIIPVLMSHVPLFNHYSSIKVITHKKAKILKHLVKSNYTVHFFSIMFISKYSKYYEIP